MRSPKPPPVIFGHTAQLRKIWHDDKEAVMNSIVGSKRHKVKSESKVDRCLRLESNLSKQLHAPAAVDGFDCRLDTVDGSSLGEGKYGANAGE
jgi:hypothetical protein